MKLFTVLSLVAVTATLAFHVPTSRLTHANVRQRFSPLHMASQDDATSRRVAFSRALSVAASLTPFVAGFVKSADAAVPFLQSPGTQPTDLGVRSDGSLKICPTNPNCLSSSVSPSDSTHYYPPLEFSKSKEAAMADIKKVLESYPAGQNGIDGGGLKVVSTKGDYIYAQAESSLFGFIDDLEFAVKDGGKVLVRSASRQGDSDLGVNAKRLNYIATKLDELGGWKTTRVG
mmetsp:Transcript_39542/g.99026  ORF Transcript_39542/g.99026 Transcript_39542/m.99026 type:complete len:231 (-) Transcript_39542:419-1111(-)